MIRVFARYLAPVSAIQVALLAISLIWCGESDCTGVGKSEDCSALVCIVLSKDASPTQDFSLNTLAACSCVCHLKALPKAENFTPHVIALAAISIGDLYAVLDLSREPIVRPPVAC
jgi:hypothetical protein